MELLYPRCCGSDVHKSSISACVLLTQAGKPMNHIRRFGCTTRELRELVAWLRESGVEHVAMESTGFYWKRAWKVLEGFRSCWLTRRTLRQFPGARRTRRIVSGLRNCCSTDSCMPAISHP
jgi:transposase